MSKPVGIAVIGAGSIGIRGALDHLVVPDVHDRVRVTAVVDPVPGRAKAAAEKYNVPRHYERYDDALKDDAVDAVTLCSPISIHYEQGLAAIRAGKHVHFNKTMTTTAAEATHLIDEAKARKVHLVASPGQFASPVVRAMRKMVQGGTLGKVAWAAIGAGFEDYHEHEKVRTGNDVLSNINPSWYWRKPGGGPMYDMTVYGLHSLTAVLGPAKRVTAMSGIVIKQREFRGEKYETDADDNTHLLVDFGDNCIAFVYGAVKGMLPGAVWGLPFFYGTKGNIIGLNFKNEPIAFEYKDVMDREKTGIFNLGPHVVNTPHMKIGEAHVFEDKMQLVDLIRDGKPPLATPEHARHVIEIIEAGYNAAGTGQTQTLKTTFGAPAGL
jgi:predicted dehydrogenase